MVKIVSIHGCFKPKERGQLPFLRLMPIEIKSGKTFNRDFLSGLNNWARNAGDAALPAHLVYGGAASMTRSGVTVHGWREITTGVDRAHCGTGAATAHPPASLLRGAGPELAAQGGGGGHGYGRTVQAAPSLVQWTASGNKKSGLVAISTNTTSDKITLKLESHCHALR